MFSLKNLKETGKRTLNSVTWSVDSSISGLYTDLENELANASN